MFVGIDLGTSSVKTVLLDRAHRVRASASAPLEVMQPQPMWREQHPEQWWHACQSALQQLLAQAGREGIATAGIDAIGLSGQMHGATLLDGSDRVLRPAILWNDGRSAAECEELERRVPEARRITGNRMMPGFTAPKLLWLARHEPDRFARVARVLLPKDYLRLKLTGEYATDLSDAAGTMWVDVAARDWSDPLLQATGLARSQMPALHEGPQITGTLRDDIARQFGLHRVPVVAGAGDNAAGALGMGLVRPGQGMLSLGTSGVYFVVTDGFRSNDMQGVHSFCHALPRTWHLMSVMLSAAACLDHTGRLTGQPQVAALLDAAKRRGFGAATPLYLPYLNGERTPHDDPSAKAVFFGIDASTEPADLVNATLEGVGQGLLDGIEAVEATGVRADETVLIGGGARSGYWAQMLADIVGRPLLLREGAEIGPALGAARLARLGVEDGDASTACPVPAAIGEVRPDPARHRMFGERRLVFKRLYAQLRPLYRHD